MSELESAASLFGSSSDSSRDPFTSNEVDDPFSAIVSSNTHDSTTSDPFSTSNSPPEHFATAPASETPFYSTSRNDSDIFASITNQYQVDSQPEFPPSVGDVHGGNSWSGGAVDGDGVIGGNRAVTAASDLGSDVGARYEPTTSMQTQTYGRERSGYQTQNGFGYGYSGYAQNSASELSTPAPNVYDPYASQSGTTYNANAYDSYAPKLASTAPAQSANGYNQSNAYTPAIQAQTSHQTFTATNSTYSYASTTNSTYTTTSQNLQSVPPPPVPKAPLNRPKVSNAYDPPFPVTSSTRRAPRNVYSFSSAYGSPPPPDPTSSVTILYGSSYGPAQHPSSSPSAFHQPKTTTTIHDLNSASLSQDQPSQIANGAQFLPSQGPSVDPHAPQSTANVYSTPMSTSVSPSPPRSSFSPPPRNSSVTSSLRSPPINISPLTGIASPPQAPLRNASPEGLMSSRNGSMQTVSTVTPPPASEVSRVSSPASLRTGSPSIHNLVTHPQSSQQILRTSSPAPLAAVSSAVADSYAPNTSRSTVLAAAPSELRSTANPYLPNSLSLESIQSTDATFPSSREAVHDSRYLPKTSSTLPPVPFNGPPLPSDGPTASDSYALARRPHKQTSEADYGPFTSRYDYPNQELLPPVPSHSLGPPQEVKALTHAPYAPSPSLLGTNDPLGRTSAHVPVFSFGFGGRIVTCFHGADKLSTGFDVALASRNSTGVQIRVLNKIIPESALDLSPSFPGPLFSDPGTPTTGLVRPGASAQIKNKKIRLLKYLSDRAEEISLGLGYLHTGSPEKRQAEGKLVLVQLLKIMIEHDGKLVGSPQAEVAIRNALVPELDLSVSANSGTDTFVSPGFSAIGENRSLRSQLAGSADDPLDPAIQVTTLRPSSLDKIQDFLLRGEKRKAYHYALDQKLWAHAMVIASGIDKEAWKEVVNEFLRMELGSKDMAPRPNANLVLSQSQAPAVTTNGREGLRVAYSLLSGQGAAAVQELIPHSSIVQLQGQPRLGIPISHSTPMTPNFVAPPPAANIPPEALSKWAEMVAMMLSGNMSPETSSALTALGDQLSGNQWVEAGHVCYLLSPQTSPIGGLVTTGARIILLGAPHPQISTSSLRNNDAVVFSEILEFALGLNPPVKGHEPFHGLPHLQAFRLIRAILLAEVGEIALASRYCEAIAGSMNRSSPYFTSVLSDQLRGLTDRIAGTAHSEKSNSWVGNKLGKPSLDSIGGWLEGRFTKLVTGDPEEDNETRNDGNKGDEQGYTFSGPFSSQYSAISSTTTSNDPSPQSSVVNLNSYAPPSSIPGRTGSSMSNRSLLNHHSVPVPVPQERAASAMDYGPRRKASPGPRIASASASTTTFAQSRIMGQARSIYSPPGTAKQEEVRRTSFEINEEDEGQEVKWWGASGHGDDVKTPRTATFVQFAAADQPITTSEDGFISLMDSNHYMPQPSANASQRSSPTLQEEEEEDLGFGNSKRKPKTSNSNESDPAKDANESKVPPQRPEVKPTPAANSSSSGSWLSRWWRRESTPGPVKANLGEEKTFYYDKELKRWVNKATEVTNVPKSETPPPPPSRAQTTSPGMSSGAGPRPPSTGPPPPPRSASAADVTGSGPPPPKGGTMRIRSNLVPSDAPHSLPSTPAASSLTLPSGPPSRPRSSQAAKRNLRSRYVDVFQQEGAA
ncbi:hypothetical protein E1B28_008846 [Marasmius oreades]|uniref:Protein transport protein sec16 n=1 Tax=Marasmius oreades TaxID=181124 RepID=A0A9P7USS9_9AGAR|nr:uncharacterized protein E1B28_008846 [Marasmius oreades]KAG7092495.1 hypothetical protein E1B28_008846 [Marasmius oreades]